MSELSEDFLDYALLHDFGDIHFKVDRETGMKAIIAIHNTNLGPALGGCRFIRYPDTMAALYDAMRLARGMTYKSALVNLPLGGGKSVIIEPETPYDRTAYLRKFGQFVEELNGRYITALDSGTNLPDMDIIAEHTSYVASLSVHNGDPAPWTARGVLNGILAAALFKLKRETPEGLHIAIQGLGHVGWLLAKHLHAMGARLTVADINRDRVEQAARELDAEISTPEAIHKTPCDLFAPCALGGIINDKTIPEFATGIIAGAANNQLAHSYHGRELFERGILYAPDYVINAGGVIFAASKYFHTAEEQVDRHIADIKTILLEIFNRSTHENLPTSDIADLIARERVGL